MCTASPLRAIRTAVSQPPRASTSSAAARPMSCAGRAPEIMTRCRASDTWQPTLRGRSGPMRRRRAPTNRRRRTPPGRCRPGKVPASHGNHYEKSDYEKQPSSHLGGSSVPVVRRGRTAARRGAAHDGREGLRGDPQGLSGRYARHCRRRLPRCPSGAAGCGRSRASDRRPGPDPRQGHHRGVLGSAHRRFGNRRFGTVVPQRLLADGFGDRIPAGLPPCDGDAASRSA